MSLWARSHCIAFSVSHFCTWMRHGLLSILFTGASESCLKVIVIFVEFIASIASMAALIWVWFVLSSVVKVGFKRWGDVSSNSLSSFYRTDYTDSQTLLNGCTGNCVRLSRPLVGFWTHFKSLHFHHHLFALSSHSPSLLSPLEVGPVRGSGEAMWVPTVVWAESGHQILVDFISKSVHSE